MMKPILQIVFPEGNSWFYIISGVWVPAITIFFVSLPLLLVSTGYWYEHENGTTIDFDSDLANLSAYLYGVAYNILLAFALFIVVSFAFDIYYVYLAKKRREAEYL